MTESAKLSYADAGVDIDAGNEVAGRFLKMMSSTFRPEVVRNDGGFGGMFAMGDLAKSMVDPVLVSGTDGVGTKLKVAFMMGKHDTVGIDLVAMSVNDILVQGAEPLFFLDYIGTGKVEKDVLADVVKGVSDGCMQSGCSLLGGETAELPGFYAAGEYDLAGFAVGIVDRPKVIDGKLIVAGDILLGLPSTGLHSNGFSLARKAILEVGGLKVTDTPDELGGKSVGEVMLTPTKIYVKPVLAVIKENEGAVKGLVHVTGGGLVENTPRILPENCNAEFKRGSWPTPPIFELIQKCGDIETSEMDRVFNMGLGMILVCAKDSVDQIKKTFATQGQACYEVGRIVAGSCKTVYA